MLGGCSYPGLGKVLGGCSYPRLGSWLLFLSAQVCSEVKCETLVPNFETFTWELQRAQGSSLCGVCGRQIISVGGVCLWFDHGSLLRSAWGVSLWDFRRNSEETSQINISYFSISTPCLSARLVTAACAMKSACWPEGHLCVPLLFWGPHAHRSQRVCLPWGAKEHLCSFMHLTEINMSHTPAVTEQNHFPPDQD